MNYEDSKKLGDLLTKHKDKIAFISEEKVFRLQKVLHIVNDEAMIVQIIEEHEGEITE